MNNKISCDIQEYSDVLDIDNRFENELNVLEPTFRVNELFNDISPNEENNQGIKSSSFTLNDIEHDNSSENLGESKRSINLMFKMNYPQNKAINKVQSCLKGTILKKTEVVVNAKLIYLPIWQVICDVDKYEGPFGLDLNVPFISKKVAVADNLYVSALGGEILSRIGRKIIFLSVLPKNKNRIRDLKLDKISLVESTNDDIIGTLMKPKIAEKNAKNLTKGFFGVKIRNTRLVRLPVWKFIIDNGSDNKRNLCLDTVFGNEILGLKLQ